MGASVYGDAVYGAAVYGDPRTQGTGRGGVIYGELWRADLAGALLEDLSASVVAGFVEWDAERAGGTPMTCRFTLRRTDQVRALADYLVPYLVIEYDDGRRVRQQTGQFLVDQPTERIRGLSLDTRYPLVQEADVTGSDLTRLLAESTFLDTQNYAAGTVFRTAIVGIIEGAGITRHNLRASTKAMGYARSFRAGTTRLEAANKLLTAIGWYPLFTDLDGRLTSMPYKRLSLTTPQRSYAQIDPIGDVLIEPTPGRVANTIVVIKDRGSEAPLTAVRTNDDPDDPYSTVNVGRQIMPPGGPVQASDAEDQQAVDDLADRLLEEARSYERTVRLRLLPDPDPPLYGTVKLTIDTEGANLFGNYWVKGWRVGFSPAEAPLELTLNRLVRAGFGEDVSQ